MSDSYKDIRGRLVPHYVGSEVEARSDIERLLVDNAALEAKLSKMEEAEIRVGADDEYVHGPLFHMERMHEGHIWFRIGDEAFDLYASDGTRLTWVPQTSGGWDALAADDDLDKLTTQQKPTEEAMEETQ